MFRAGFKSLAKIASPAVRRKVALTTGLVGTTGFALTQMAAADSATVDYKAVRADIADMLDQPGYDDGSVGPVLVRLGWHASGTYNVHDGSGGSDGATMRFDPEASHGANAGLDVARACLEPIKQRHEGISYGDLWTLASVVAIEEMGGPEIAWKPGRTDKPDGTHCTPDGRLPDALQGAQHLRDIFYRMGFNDQEIVALSGAHSLGRCHTTRSGFDGPWTNAPTTFSNLYFTELLERTWVEKEWNGPKQYVNKDGQNLMMLVSDLALTSDPKFRPWVELYAKDEERFFKDFSSAYQRLTENGVKFSRDGSWTPIVAMAAMTALATRYGS